MKRGEEKWALCFGSIVGALQMALGLAISKPHGMLAAFIASTLLYVVSTQLYLWATKQEEADEQQDK